MIEVALKLKGSKGSCESLEVLGKLRKQFSIENPNPKAKRFNSRIHTITPTGAFDIGLWQDIYKFISKGWPEAKFSITKGFREKFQPTISIDKVSKIKGWDYYSYQEDAILKSFQKGRGIIRLPTASGKTLIMGGMCKSYLDKFPKAKILIMVPNTSLLSKTYTEFTKDFGIKSVGVWTGMKNPPCKLDWSHNIIISNFQKMTSDVKETISLFQDYDLVIIDEVHRITRSSQISKVVNSLKTDNRFGLTGTIPKDELDAWNIIGKVGPVFYEKSSREIREDIGSISDVRVKVIRLTHKGHPKKYICAPNEEFNPTGQYDNEIDFIYNSDWRNRLITDIANRLNGNCLILVDRLFHGEMLKDLIATKSFKEVYFVNGDMPVSEREEIIAKMEVQNNIACVSVDTIFSTGISINNLKYVIFVCIGKSYTKVLQSIGRSLRLHPDKDMAYIYDISDTTHYSSKHSNERFEFYKEEEIQYEIRKIKENS